MAKQRHHISKLSWGVSLNIKEFSKISGISPHTLRYYERIGVLQEIRRNASGHRDFSEKDLLWAEFVNRLKETGMPLEQIKKYAFLRQEGEKTANARKILLENHASVLRKRILKEKQHLQKLEEKIEYYNKTILSKESY